MKTYQFKTNINCGGCVAGLTPHLNSNKGIKEWKVDTTNPGKILTVKTDNIEEDEVKAIVEKAGFKVQKIEQ
ncbi:MAG: heavy-metal-associated domain-containing protein [Chitinophagaceae bacterium]|nr:heavy-metal-associated domain-containing protein [Chitinophagaceae bacterium]